MKKYITLLFLAAAFGFVSCDVETKITPGGTAVEDMCGFWDVTVNGVDADGNIIDEDLLDGRFRFMTYNTADNSSSQMWIDDTESFWAIKFKVDVDYASRNFRAAMRPYDEAGTGNAEVLEGKILKNAGKSEHGMPCDSIFVSIRFDDDDPASPYDHYTYQGIRHGGY